VNRLRCTPPTSHTNSACIPQMPGSVPSPARVSRWTSRTRSMFNPLEDAEQRRMRIIFCPKCRTPIENTSVTRWPFILCTILIVAQAFANREGTGYLQEKFSVRCPRFICNSTMTKATLAVRKFAEDLILNDTTARSYLAYVRSSRPWPHTKTQMPRSQGTLHTAKMNMDVHRAMSSRMLL